MTYRLLLIFLPFVFSFSAPTKKILLTIGITRFQDKLFKRLEFAAKDAEDANKQFEEHGFDVRTIKNVGKKDDLISKLKEIEKINLFEDDTVVVIISTHGTVDIVDGEPTKYIVTSDTNERDVKGTAVSFNYIIELFEQLEAKNKALILCTCYSGVGKSAYSNRIIQLNQRSKGMLGVKFLSDSESSLVLSASSYNQKAIEDDTLKNDVYLHFLLKNLKIEHDELGYSSLVSAHEKAVFDVYEFTGGNQTPSEYGQRSGLNPILISGTPEKYGSKLYQGSVDLDQWETEIDGQLVNFKQGLHNLKPGFHKLRFINKKTQKSFSRNIRFKSGSGHNLRNLLVPISLNSVNFGYGLILSSDPNFEHPIKGFGLTYQRNEFFQDLSLKVVFFHGDVKEQSPVVGIDSRQTRQLNQIYTAASYSNKIDFLSKLDQTLDAELSLDIGLTFSHSKIDRKNDSFESKIIQSYSLGPKVQSELMFKTHHDVQFGTRIEASYLADLTQSYGFHTFLGVFW